MNAKRKDTRKQEPQERLAVGLAVLEIFELAQDGPEALDCFPRLPERCGALFGRPIELHASPPMDPVELGGERRQKFPRTTSYHPRGLAVERRQLSEHRIQADQRLIDQGEHRSQLCIDLVALFHRTASLPRPAPAPPCKAISLSAAAVT